MFNLCHVLNGFIYDYVDMKNDMNRLEWTIKSHKEQLKVAANDNIQLRYGALSFLVIFLICFVSANNVH